MTIAGVLLIAAAAPASAEVTIAVSPVLLELEGRAGDTGRIEITITNSGDEAFDVATGLDTFQSMTGDLSAVPWSSVTPERLSLEPGTSGTATYAIDIPADADPGGRYATVTVTTVPDAKAGTTGLAGRIVVPVFLTVQGEGDPDRTTVLERTALFLEPDGRLGVRAEVQNTGDVHVPFAGTVALTAIDPALEASMNLVAGRVLPGRTRVYTGETTLPLPLSTSYEATLRMGTPDEADMLTGDPVHERSFAVDATPALTLDASSVCENLDRGPSVAAQLTNGGTLGITPAVTFAVLDESGSPLGTASPDPQPLAWPGEATNLAADLPGRLSTGSYTLVTTVTYGGAFSDELRLPFTIGGDPATAAPLCAAPAPSPEPGT